MPREAASAANDSATGVFPAPPATRLPTQMTGTGARSGLAEAARSRPTVPQAAAKGANKPAAMPGGAAQKSGVRIGVEHGGGALPEAFQRPDRRGRSQRIE